MTLFRPALRTPALAAWVAILMLSVGLAAAPAWGGGTPDPGNTALSTTNRNGLLGILGPDRGFGFGDYLTDRVSGLQRGGAVETYDYYIEVPPGQAQLVLQIFDADAGAGDNLATTPANEDLHDENNGNNNWEMTTTYELFDPSGASVAVRNLAGQDCDPVTAGLQNFCDNTWSDLGAFTISNPAPGHWRLAVGSPNSALTQEDDSNSYGLRAHDGDATAAGSEFPIYANTLIGLGQLYAGSAGADPGLSRTHDLFPFIRRDCTCESNDWDSDSTAPIDESTVFTTRTGATPTGSNGTLSQGTLWRQNVLTGWTTEQNATDYGLWRLRWTTGRFNHLTYYMGDETNFDPSNAAPGPGNGQEPNSNPENGAIRLYFPADGSRLFGLVGGANDVINPPLKPWVGQSWALVAGQPPIEANVSTTVRVTITVANPTARPIQFSAVTGGTNVIVATLPDNLGQTTYVPGSATITGGSSTDTSVTGTGPWTIRYAPGVIPAGVTALLTYDVQVTPTPTGLPKSLFFVGTFGTATAGTYVDETCANGAGGASVCGATALAAATMSIGPLCRLTALVSTAPSLGIAKRINGAVTDNGNGTFSVPFRLVVENLGTTTITPLQVADNLAATFPAPATVINVTAVSASILSGVGNLTANAGFNGVGNINLLTAATSSLNPGASGQLDFSVTFDPSGVPGPFFNQASVSGTTTLGGTVGDTSDDGTDPDPDGDGIGNEPGTGCPSTVPSSNCENDPTPVTTSVGNLSITPTTLPFGNQVIGTTSAAGTVTLANTGTASLSVTALTAATAPFARAGGTCANTLPITLAAGANCTLTFTFAPTAAVASNQTLTVTANAPGSGTITLSGTGVQGNLTINPATVPFGNQAVGTTSAASTVTLANTGSASLDVTALTAAAAPFARAGGTCATTLPITLAAGANCTLTYTFAPSATVASNQTLTVTANAPGSGTIVLSGTGVQGNLTITPTTLPFGNQAVGTTSGASTVTLANTGSAALDVTALTAATAPFARAGGTCATTLPITIAAGANCTLTFTFAPSAAVASNQTLTVTANAPGSGTITLSGTGVQGNLTINPASVPFGNQAVGTTSAASTVTLANTGSVSLDVTALSAAAAPFARVGGTCANTLPITLAAGASCTLSYTFAPTAAVASNQTLTVTAGTSGSGTIALSGTGVVGVLSLSTVLLDFQLQIVGTISTRTLTLSNTGQAPLTVSALSAVSAPFALTAAGSCPALPITLAPGANCTLVYSFSAATEDFFQQSVTITTSVGTSTVQLRGATQVSIQIPTLQPGLVPLLGLLILSMGVITLRSRR